MSKRIGPQMETLAASVREGDSILSLVQREYTTRNGYTSTGCGYAVVHRAIAAGMIKAKVRKGRYILSPA